MKEMFKKNRAQAALEFLTTYGWAFLVILIMIGALAYFGVLNPSNLTPDKCVASSGFTCRESTAVAATADAVQFVLTNGPEAAVFDVSTMDATLTGSSTCTTIDLTSASTFNGVDETGADQNVPANGEIIVNLDCDVAPVAGEKPSVTYSIEYTPVGKTFGKTMTVEVAATVQ